MTPHAIQEALQLTAKLWPKADWPPELQAEYARRLQAIPLDFEQAKAALLNLRMDMKWATVQPCELLAALNAASRTTPGEPDLDGDVELVRQALALPCNRAELHRFFRDWQLTEPCRGKPSAFQYWQPEDALDRNEPAKWRWGVRFCLWASERLTASSDRRLKEPDVSLAELRKAATTRGTRDLQKPN